MKHLKQIECFNDPARFKLILAGRRGGKTYLLTEDILKTACSMPSWAEIFYIGPTNTQAIEIIWEPLIKRLDELGWSYDDKISKHRIELANHKKIYIIGAEKIKRVRGHAVAKAYLDEVAYYETDLNYVWRTVRPTLTDLKGGAICSTTPDGKGTQAYDFYMDKKGDGKWKYFYWTSRDNPFLDPEEILEAQDELDEKSYKQEYEALWESFEGLAYYSFHEDQVKLQKPVDFNLPVHLAFDFNVNPTTLLISQLEDGKMRYKREYSFPNSSTEETVIEFCADYAKYAANMSIKIRGDAAGSARSSNTGRSDYQYVQEILTASGFRWEMQVLSANPPIVDRVKKVNSWLKSFTGLSRIEIDPSCKELIKDLSSQEVKGRIPSDKNNRGHKTDALGYDIYYQDKIGNITRSSSRIL